MSRSMKVLAALVCGAMTYAASAQQSTLSVEKIMQNPDTWIGGWPSRAAWAEDGSTLYFFWNPQGQFPADSLYMVAKDGGDPVKVSPEERRNRPPSFDGWHHGEHVYDRNFVQKVYDQGGDLYLYDRREGTTTRLTDTRDRESNPRWTVDDRSIIFEKNDNLFRLDDQARMVQLTDLRSGNERKERQPDEQDAFLKEQQEGLFAVIARNEKQREEREQAQEREDAARDEPPTFYIGDRSVQQLALAPGGRYVTFVLSDRPSNDKATEVEAYVTESGYAEERRSRPKVGNPATSSDLYVQDLQRDSTYQVDLYQLDGAYDVPAFLREQGVKVDSTKKQRVLYSYGPYWSGDGRYAVVDVRTRDNKDRWIARLDPETASLTVLDRQHDDAWIAGPGISWFGGPSDAGWLPDNRRFYFQSEASGYSHLYTVDVDNGNVKQLTSGDFEVFDPMISRDGKTWFFTSSEMSPFVRHFYRMPIDGGERTILTTMEGNNGVTLNPDEQTMGLLFSFTNQPPEIYLQPFGRQAQRITHSPTDEWSAYSWRPGEIIHFEASDGVQVPAQIFEPAHPNGAAVFFVHGAGYLQNVHEWWSSYFREYMFNNMLTDLGYVVMNVDYRGSSGYGRDWRTAIYRHMGGRDLQDYVDASRYLTQSHGISPEKMFIYGGSYGGFMTLMALFTAPDYFGGGAALRSVTDWAHYNHTYTANILNTPAEDSLAYAQSSPIYFADGLQDPLLIAHGVVDTNVHFQDVVRLAQRLIELGKQGWDMAIYPVENHGFTEPESWTDEYRRILRHIRLSVGPKDEALEEVPLLQKEAGDR